MAAENKNYTETEIMLGALDRVVREEMKKKPSKRDDKLIDECIAEMAKLKNVRAGYTEEEIGAIVEQLQEKAANKPKQEPVRRKSVRRMAAVVCAACLIMVSSVATVAWNPFSAVKEWVLKVTESQKGTTLTYDEIIYSNRGETREYDSIGNLIYQENLDIYYPSVLPDNIYVTQVELLAINQMDCVKIYFNDLSYQFTIQLNTPLYINAPECETIELSGNTFYISKQNNKYIVRSHINSNLYLIEAPNYQDILLIIENFIKG